MKKRLFSLVLVLCLCMGLTVPVMAAEPEDASYYGASTWTNHMAYGLSGIKISKSSNAADRKAFEEATGLTVFSQKEVFAFGDSPEGGAFTQEYLGLKDSTGTVVFPAEFTSMEYIGENRIVANRSDKTRKDEATKSWAELGLDRKSVV